MRDFRGGEAPAPLRRHFPPVAIFGYTPAMSEIVNLRQARKRKVRAEKEAAAAANRAKFGRTKSERKQTEAERARAARDLDGKKRD